MVIVEVTHIHHNNLVLGTVRRVIRHNNHHTVDMFHLCRRITLTTSAIQFSPLCIDQINCICQEFKKSLLRLIFSPIRLKPLYK